MRLVNQNACNGQPTDGAELEKLVALRSPNVCRESDLYCLLDMNVQSTDTVDANVSPNDQLCDKAAEEFGNCLLLIDMSPKLNVPFLFSI